MSKLFLVTSGETAENQQSFTKTEQQADFVHAQAAEGLGRLILAQETQVHFLFVAKDKRAVRMGRIIGDETHRPDFFPTKRSHSLVEDGPLLDNYYEMNVQEVVTQLHKNAMVIAPTFAIESLTRQLQDSKVAGKPEELAEYQTYVYSIGVGRQKIAPAS